MNSQPFIADLHIHSRYSRATARNLDLEHIYIWAQLKGIRVVGTGDFTHPEWFSQLDEKLEPAEPGLFRLKETIACVCDREVPLSCRAPVRFLLSSEISNIYKRDERTRKNHNLVFFPTLETVRRFNGRLNRIGNIHSDGRPILGLDARDLLEIVLEVSDEGFLVPAHIWTPWFSMLGSKSGFDSIDACFQDLSAYIFAAETGLSSDPAMNWRVSGLDRLTLISNSDAHSPSKLGREANLFKTPLSYYAMRTAMETGDQDNFAGTFEFYPEEGKYHVDGHRKCDVRFTPEQTKAHGGKCPVCGKPLTLGVLHRVDELATRKEGFLPEGAVPFYRLIPLEDLLSEILRVGPQSKKVKQTYQELVAKLGSEFKILHFMSRDGIQRSGVPLLGEAIARVRDGRIAFEPGFDGRFGKVKIFSDRERDQLLGQRSLFSSFETIKEPEKKPKLSKNDDAINSIDGAVVHQHPSHPVFELNPDQSKAVNYSSGSLMIVAGPGTGKTRTLTHKIACLMNDGVDAHRILAVTFTHKAAAEMKARLEMLLREERPLPYVGTFHSLGFQILSQRAGDAVGVIDEKIRKAIVVDTLALNGITPDKKGITPDALMGWIVDAKQKLRSENDPLDGICPPEQLESFTQCYRTYQHVLQINGLVDFEDLILRSIKLLENDPTIRDQYVGRYRDLFVDEYQDINSSQYRLVRLLAGERANICIIGDPDQSIYGFRGSEPDCFNWFTQDQPDAQTLFLSQNYRSTQTIVDVSTQVIEHNPQNTATSIRKSGFSTVPGDRSIHVIEAGSERAEAVFIGKKIEKMVGGTGFFSLDSGAVNGNQTHEPFSFVDFAVLFRTRSQAAVISKTLQKAGIPCQRADRRTVLAHPGIQSILATAKVLHGMGLFSDMQAMQGVFCPPSSAATLDILKTWAYRNNLSLAATLIQARRLPIPRLSRSRQQRIYDFANRLKRYRQQIVSLSVMERLEWIAMKAGLTKKCKADPRFENGYRQLLTIAETTDNDMSGFLAAVALTSSTDIYDQRVEKVALMTMHAAKGLEFPVVFIAGCEDGWIPYHHTQRSANLEEERRLFYVALTRAKRHLFLCYAKKRMIHGKTQRRRLSPFVTEIDNRYKQVSVNHGGRPQPELPEQLTLFD